MFFKAKHKGTDVNIEIPDSDVLKKIAEQDARIKSLETASNKTNTNYADNNTDFDIDDICQKLLNDEIKL